MEFSIKFMLSRHWRVLWITASTERHAHYLHTKLRCSIPAIRSLSKGTNKNMLFSGCRCMEQISSLVRWLSLCWTGSGAPMESPNPDSSWVDKTSLTQSSQWEIKGHHATCSTQVSWQEQQRNKEIARCSEVGRNKQAWCDHFSSRNAAACRASFA